MDANRAEASTADVALDMFAIFVSDQGAELAIDRPVPIS
jgi:hypothetical protein